MSTQVESKAEGPRAGPASPDARRRITALRDRLAQEKATSEYSVVATVRTLEQVYCRLLENSQTRGT